LLVVFTMFVSSLMTKVGDDFHYGLRRIYQIFGDANLVDTYRWDRNRVVVYLLEGGTKAWF